MINRRLSAVMFADIVGYTALMQRDERSAIAARRKYRDILDEQVSQASGETIQYYGDGALTLFPSAVAAIQCGVEMQKAMRRDPRVDVRIGIHVGEVIVDDEGVYGDAVNITSRIESLAEPGAVYVSDKVFDELRNQPQVLARSLGSRDLKNVRRPVHVYAIEAEGIVVPASVTVGEPTVPTPTPVERSVAVLPFVNMSTDPENEFFSDGITEEIINALTRVRDLKVTSRTSSFAFKGSNTDIRGIAEQLHVGHVLEGSVRKAGSRIRVTAQLIKASDGFHLFSHVYDRELVDVFEIQDEISEKITNELRSAFGDGESQAWSSAPPPSVEAYTNYLQARHLYYRWTPETVRSSLAFYRKAIDADPNYGKAYAGIASSYSFLAALGRGGYGEARDAAEKALELDPSSAEPHLALGMVAIFADWDAKTAEEHLTEAVQLGPGHVDAHYVLSMFNMVRGNHDAAVAHGQIAVELDPLSLPVLGQLGGCLALRGDLDEGLVVLDRALEIDPTFRGAHEWKGWIRLENEDYEEALTSFREFARLSPNRYAGASSFGVVYARMGDTDRAREQLNRLKERERVEPGTNLHQDFAALLMAIGDVDGALERLEQAVDAHLGSLVFLKSSSLWDSAADHPRFQAILDRIGFWAS